MIGEDGLLRAAYARLRTVLVDAAGDAVTDRDGDAVTVRYVLTEDAVSEVPQFADTAENYPDVLISIPSSEPFDTKTSLGIRAILRVRVISDKGDWDEVNSLFETVYLNFHRQPLEIDRRRAVSVDFRGTQRIDGPTAPLKIGVQDYSVLYEWAPSITT